MISVIALNMADPCLWFNATKFKEGGGREIQGYAKNLLANMDHLDG
jgi:hypothetical protein